MKKKLSLLMVAFMAVAAFAGLNSWRAAGDPSYTITFQTTGTANDASQAVTTVEDIIADGATYVSEISNAVKVYKGRDGRGIKLGTASVNGEITLKLANAVKPSKIVVKARKYNDTSNAITINGQEFEINDGTSDDCVLNYDGNTEVSEIAIVANKFRAYVISIAVYEASETPAEDVYVVAGSSTTLFGTAWNPSAEDNDANKMTKNTETGVYEKVYAGVALPAGNIEFKIVKNGSDWIPSGDNLICTISETATYDVTFTFDPATSAITSNAEKKGEAQLPDAEINKVVFLGDFNEWNQEDEMTKGEGNVWTKVVDATAFTDDLQFKLLVNGSEWIGYGSSMIIDAPEGWVDGQNEGYYNYILKNATTGYQTYTVTASWAANTNAADGWTLKIEGKDAREAAPIVIPDGAIVFDFKSAGQAGETLTKNSANFQVNMGEGKEDRTDRNFKSYKDYAGTILPATCQVAIGEEPKVDENGLIVSYDRYLSVYGLNTGDKVRIIYSGVPDGKTPTYCPGTSVDTKAAINGSELVSTVSPIGSGDVIEITEAGEKNYVIMSVFTGMRIEMVIIEPVAEDTYTVAGAFYNSDEAQALFLETVWDPTNVKNDLEKYSDTYYFKSYAGVEFPSAGNFQVKVVKNHDWNVASYPAGNVTVAITEAGKYDVSISFDTTTSEVRVNVDPQFVPAEPIYTVVGGYYTADGEINIFNGEKLWDEKNTNADMIIVDGDDFYSLQIDAQGIELQPGTISYKVVKNHDWTENWGMAVTDENPNGNAEFKINEAGKYNILFKFNPNAKFENGYNVDCVVTTTTGIQNVKADDLKNATIYNLQGVRMQNVQKGLYIVNGKKVVVK